MRCQEARVAWMGMARRLIANEADQIQDYAIGIHQGACMERLCRFQLYIYFTLLKEIDFIPNGERLATEVLEYIQARIDASVVETT